MEMEYRMRLLCVCCNALDMKLRSCIQQTGMLHVHEKSKIAEKISTQDRILYVSDNKNPSEVEGERSGSKCRNR